MNNVSEKSTVQCIAQLANIAQCSLCVFFKPEILCLQNFHLCSMWVNHQSSQPDDSFLIAFCSPVKSCAILCVKKNYKG